jgi:hypothetical protein
MNLKEILFSIEFNKKFFSEKYYIPTRQTKLFNTMYFLLTVFNGMHLFELFFLLSKYSYIRFDGFCHKLQDWKFYKLVLIEKQMRKPNDTIDDDRNIFSQICFIYCTKFVMYSEYIFFCILTYVI